MIAKGDEHLREEHYVDVGPKNVSAKSCIFWD